MPTKTQRTIIPLLEENQQPNDLENFENEVKKLLEEDVPEKTTHQQDYQYELTDNENNQYQLTNQEDLKIDQLPGIDTIEQDFSIETLDHKGIEKIGVGTDGTVTIENPSGHNETYLLAGAYQGQAAIKDQEGTIWKYDTIKDQLKYRTTKQQEWIPTQNRTTKNKLDKVINFQQQLWALNRAQEQITDWKYSRKDKNKRNNLKLSFDHVMQEIANNGEYQLDDYDHTSSEDATTITGARGRSIIADFKKARNRFHAYSLLKYGIDPTEEINITSNGNTVTYEPKQF